MVFYGTYELNLDPKNRLVIPSRVTRTWDPETDGAGFYLTPGDWPRTLNMYADKYFLKFAEERHACLEPGDNLAMFETIFYADADMVEMDKQRRVLLPQRMLDKAHIGKEVTLTGARDRLVLWDRTAHEIFMEHNAARHRDLLEKARAQTQARRSTAEHN
jgi:MraZ protein